MTIQRRPELVSSGGADLPRRPRAPTRGPSRVWWLVLLSVLFWPAGASAQVKLAWQFTEGETFYVERVTTQKQSAEVNNKAFKDQGTKTWVLAVTVKQKTPAGNVLDLRTESVIVTGPGPLPMGAEVPGLDDKLTTRMKGCLFTATVTPRGKVTKFEGYAAFIRKLSEKKEEMEKVLKAIVPEEMLREDIEEVFNFLPEKAVRKGEKWKRQSSEPLAPFGSLQSAFEFMLDEDKGREGNIAYTVKMTYKLPQEGGDLFQVVKGSLKEAEGSGDIVFDTQRGKLVSNNRTVRVRGEVLVESMGKRANFEFSSENSTRIRVFQK